MSEKKTAAAEGALPQVAPPGPHLAGAPKIYKVGNLIYTRSGLGMLFLWLLWGDFCFIMMEHAFRPILQVRLVNELGASPMLFTLIMVQLPGVLNFIMNPIISVKSDRHRGPLGRRIPFLLYSTPLVCLFLAMMGFGNEIGVYLHAHLFSGMSLAGVTIWTFGVLFLVFTIFNMFLNTTFYYLFNDVVPREHFIKFMGYMRVITVLSNMLYSYFLFGFSDKTGPFAINLGFIQWDFGIVWYPKIILIGMAVFYLAGFTLACLKIKEPNYPPPAPMPKEKTFVGRLSAALVVLGKECFSHKFYWLYFLTISMDFTYQVLGDFKTPMWKDMGIDLKTIGQINAYIAPVSLALIFLTASFGDRWRPLPLMVVAMTGMVITAPIGLLFLIPGLSPNTYLWINIAFMVSHIPVNLVYAIGHQPLGMSLLPRERYGQFAAATAMVRTIVATVIGAGVAGAFLQLMKRVHGGGDYYLRYTWVWQMFFQVMTLIFFILLYREWKKLGGKHNYKPPAVEVKQPATA